MIGPRRIAVIMAGGGGTRLWPASTAGRPKQLMDPLLRPAPVSLLAGTTARLEGLVEPGDVWVVTTAEQHAGVAAALPRVPANQILDEPVGRNTAPCIALTLRHLRAHLGAEAEATIMALPADHFISDPDGFRRLLATACTVAEDESRIVTLGITPDHPATGYGYIETADTVPRVVEGAPVHAVRRFVEKPDAATARDFLESGRFYWNAGIFVMPRGRIEEALARHCPSMWSALDPVARALEAGEDPSAATATAYSAIDPAPIDIAVMEKLDDLMVIPADVGWTDLGSWASVAHVVPADDAGNALVTAPHAITIAEDVRNTLIWNEDGTVGVIGVEGLAVIVSGGRVLVCPRDRAEEVRDIVRRLQDES